MSERWVVKRDGSYYAGGCASWTPHQAHAYPFGFKTNARNAATKFGARVVRLVPRKRTDLVLTTIRWQAERSAKAVDALRVERDALRARVAKLADVAMRAMALTCLSHGDSGAWCGRSACLPCSARRAMKEGG